MWTEFAERSGKVAHNHSPLDGIDRYTRYKEGAARIRDSGSRH